MMSKIYRIRVRGLTNPSVDVEILPMNNILVVVGSRSTSVG
jgi:hypothetical protein